MNFSLAELLAAHEAYEDVTPLRVVLGDGYLHANNRVFRNIRVAVEEFGYRLRLDPFPQYRVAPFVLLPHILESKMVPYQDTKSALAEVEARRPGVFNLGDVDFLGKNAVLHESCHCLATELFPSEVKELPKVSSMQREAFRMLVGEAFATGSEFLGSLAADSKMHQYFYFQNSYVAPIGGAKVEREEWLAARACLARYGFEITSKLIYFSCLYHLFLFKTVGAAELTRVLELIGYSGKWKKEEKDLLLKVLRINCKAHSHFTLATNSFYFKYELGNQEEIFKFLRYDFMAVFEKNRSWLSRLDLLLEIAEHGLRGPRGRLLLEFRKNSRSGAGGAAAA